MKSEGCELLGNSIITDEIFRLDFGWENDFPAVRAGQFFMIRPRRSGVFLGRPISAAGFQASNVQSGVVSFLIVGRGKGTWELADMRVGECAQLIGPLGNAWTDFLPAARECTKPVALVGGGIGLAPLLALLLEAPGHVFDLYAGFRSGFADEEKKAFFGAALHNVNKIVIAAEDGTADHKGRIPDFFEPEHYAAICACGPEHMLKAVAHKAADAGVPCYVSLERRMACGVGACLGCTVKTVDAHRNEHNGGCSNGGYSNRRCCADGPVFNANEVVFDD